MQELEEIIASRIRDRETIPFDEFMGLALHHPEMGYYTTRVNIPGDFPTHPGRFSPFYGAGLAELYLHLWESIDEPLVVCEGGAGTGIMAKDALDHIAQTVPEVYESMRYVIVENSPHLAAQQERTLVDHAEKVEIHRQSVVPFPLDEPRMIFVSNELIDALPGKILRSYADSLIWSQIVELQVGVNGDGFAFEEVPLCDSRTDVELILYAKKKRAQLEQDGRVFWPIKSGLDGYLPVHFPALELYRGIADTLEQGFVISIDCGSPGIVRLTDILRTYGWKSGSEHDPFLHPGEIDIQLEPDLEYLHHYGQEIGLISLGDHSEKEMLDAYISRAIGEPYSKFWGFTFNRAIVHAKGIEQTPKILTSSASSSP